MSSVNEQLGQKYLRHALYIQSLERREAAHIAQFLKRDVIPTLESRLKESLDKLAAGKIKDKTQINRLQATLESMNAQVQMSMARAEAKMMARFKSIAEGEVKWNVDTIHKTVPLDVDLFAPSAQFIHGIVESQVIEGKKLQDWLKSFSSSNQKGIMKSAKIGIAAGESIPQIGKRIRSSLNMARNRAEWLARTVTSATVHNVRDATFKANGHILDGVQWVSTLDTRTTELCIGYDGKVFPLDDGPRPPAHFNCRSTIVPVVKSWEKFGFKNPPPSVRASMTGYVPSTTQYTEWLNKAIGAKPGKGVKPPRAYPAGTKIVDAKGTIVKETPVPKPAVPPSMPIETPPAPVKVMIGGEEHAIKVGPSGVTFEKVAPPYIVEKAVKNGVEVLQHIDPGSGELLLEVPIVPAAPVIPVAPKVFAPPIPVDQIQSMKIVQIPEGYTVKKSLVLGAKTVEDMSEAFKMNWSSMEGTPEYKEMLEIFKSGSGSAVYTIKDATGKVFAGVSWNLNPELQNMVINRFSVMDPGKGFATELMRELVNKAKLMGVGIRAPDRYMGDFWHTLGFSQDTSGYFASHSVVNKLVEQMGIPLSFKPAFVEAAVTVTSTTKPPTTDDSLYGWVKSLSKEERAAIREYTSSEYKEIKEIYWKYMSGKIKDINKLPEWRRKYLNHAINLENALMRAPGYKGTLHRGMSLYDEGDIKSFLKHYREGNTVSFANANSFSSTEQIADSFSGWNSPTRGDSIKVKIKMLRAPSKRCADINTISSHKGEDEILVGADQEYKVVKVQEFPPVIEGGNKRIYVELEPIEK